MCSPTNGLSLHQVHQVGPQNSVREAGKIFDMGCGHQLTAGNPSSLETGDQKRLEIGPGCVDRCGVPGRPGADDHKVLNMSRAVGGHRLSGMTMS